MNKNSNLLLDTSIPLGLGMALAQDTGAMQYFATLPMPEKQAIIDKAHAVKTKEEMQALVSGLATKN